MARSAREPPVAKSTLPAQTLVVDPGSYTIKAGLVSLDDDQEAECSVIPNCIARARTKQTYIGSDLSKCNDYGEMQFKRPVEKGYVVNWDLERALFEHEFLDAKAPLCCDPASTCLLMAEPSNATIALQSNSDQIIFEEFSFAAASRINTASLNAFTPLPPSLSDPSHPSPASRPPLPTEIMLLIDAGHSSTTITPLLRGQPLHQATRRITIGGKHISNHLAELISLRHFSLMDEPHIVSQIKEDTCFVSADFKRDMAAVWAGPRGARRVPDPAIAAEYVLPDYTRLHRGVLRPRGAAPAADREEAFPLTNERFAPPELLFHPADVGMPESGIPHTVMQALAALPEALAGPLLANVVLVGGTSLLPGYAERVQAEIRALAPAGLPVRVARAEDPVGNAWQGGAGVARYAPFRDRVMVTRQEYEENGEAWVRREFARRRVVEDWAAAASAAKEGDRKADDDVQIVE